MLNKIRSLPPLSFLLEMVKTYDRVGVARSAAALSYFLILTLFPLLMCVNYFIGLFHLDLEQFLLGMNQFFPEGVLSVLSDYLAYVAGSQSSGLLWASLFTLVVSASAGLRTLFATMDQLFGVEGRRPGSLLLVSVLLSVLLLLTIYLSVVVIFTGDWFFWVLEGHLPRRLAELMPLPALSQLWKWIRYLLLFCFVLVLLLLVYRAGIPRRLLSNRAVLVLSSCTALTLVACSGLFSWFIGMSSRYALVYGSLASLIILLVWLYFCGNILLLGAVTGRVWFWRRTRPTDKRPA